MPSFFSFVISKRFPSRNRLRELFGALHTRAGALLWTSTISAIVILYILLIEINSRFLVTIPAQGGTLVEGIIGAPRFINPLLAKTTTDQTLSSLVYASLLRRTPSGELKNELALRYEVSPNGLIYTFDITKDATFSDGTPLSANDIIFTVERMQDATIDADLARYWQTVTVEAIDADTIVFTLSKAEADFPARTTFGILPKHIWNDVPSELFAASSYNLKPIGAGAFTVSRVSYDDGVPKKVILTPFDDYILGEPLLGKLVLSIYANKRDLSRAIESGDVDLSVALDPQNIYEMKLPKDMGITSVETTTTFALYRRSDDPMLSDGTLLRIIDRYLDRKKIIDTIEYGYATSVATSPVLSLEEAHAELAKAGYRYHDFALYKGSSPIGLSIAVENTPDSVALANAVAQELQALGMIVSIKAYDPGTFLEQVQESGYSVILSKARTLPGDQYRPALTLYREILPVIATSDVGIPVTGILASPLWRYTEAPRWYVNTDKVYQWLANRKND